MKLWPWTKKVVERGNENWMRYHTTGGFLTGEPRVFNRDFVIYEVTNHFTGSVTIRKEYLN